MFLFCLPVTSACSGSQRKESYEKSAGYYVLSLGGGSGPAEVVSESEAFFSNRVPQQRFAWTTAEKKRKKTLLQTWSKILSIYLVVKGLVNIFTMIMSGGEVSVYRPLYWQCTELWWRSKNMQHRGPCDVICGGQLRVGGPSSNHFFSLSDIFQSLMTWTFPVLHTKRTFYFSRAQIPFLYFCVQDKGRFLIFR